MKSVCNSINTATAYNPIFIIDTSLDIIGDSSSYESLPYNISTWCRELSDGTITQGAYTVLPQNSGTYTYNTSWSMPFIKPYTTTNINIMITPTFNSKPTTGSNGGICVDDPDSSYFTVVFNGSSNRYAGFYWEATGV